MPTIAKAVNVSRKIQSILMVPMLPAKPMSELKAMMTKEVATAFFIGNFASYIKVGMIKKPPPTPTKPVSKPIIMPCTIIFLVVSCCFSGVFSTGLFLIMEIEEKIINVANTNIMTKSFVKMKLP